MSGDGAKDEAKQLLNKTICGDSYSSWLKERQLTRPVPQVREFRELVFETYASKLQGERAQLERERLKPGMSAMKVDEIRSSIERSLWVIWGAKR